MTRDRVKIDQADNRQIETVSGALIGVGVVVVTQLLRFDSLDWPLTVSLFSFTISLPCLSIILLNLLHESRYTYFASIWYNNLIQQAGGWLSLIGMIGIFWHLSVWAGILFTLLGCAGFLAFWHYGDLLKEVNSRNRPG
jgi:uncharacterized protein involved in cysteine biosynthesis